MINLTSRICILFCFQLTLVACGESAKSNSGIDCAVSAIGKDSIARVHQEQKRFFVVSDEVKIESLRELVAEMRSCFSGNKWEKQWSLSVFSKKQLAGYKDEPRIVPFHKNDEWSKAYLGEYDDSTGILTLDPVTSPRTVDIEGSPKGGTP